MAALIEEWRDPSVVVALDFGTTYAGYAYTGKDEFRKSNETREIYHNRWSSQLAGNLSTKAPCVALFDPNFKFHSFGYEAEEKYAELADLKQHEQWHYFRRFKMQLYGKLHLDRNFEIEDQSGRPYRALSVFSESIKFLRTEALKELKERIGLENEGVIHWVLTIPAIWNEPAKQFMREAAIKAGIKDHNLCLALEPEAAAIYCKTLPDILSKDILNFLNPGGRYMILDMGGGTVDIAVHEVAKDGSLIEIVPASGGDWGGTTVDRRFLDYISEKMGKNKARRLKKDRMSYWMKLEENFETTKRKLKFTTAHDVRADIPPVLIYEGDLVGNDDMSMSFKLTISIEDFRSFFVSVMKVTDRMKQIMGKVKGIELILMVGGFSQSDYVANIIKTEFSGMKVLVPPKAEEAVLEGAVMFGFEPWTISARMVRYTYGIQCNTTFIEGEHKEEYRRNIDGEDRCQYIFSKMVTEGEILEIGGKCTEKYHSTHKEESRKQLQMMVPIFVSTDTNPKYTTETSCQKIGNIVVNPPEEGWPDFVRYRVEMFFGRTEFEMKVFNDASGDTYSTKVDFLSNAEYTRYTVIPTKYSEGKKTSSFCVVS